VARGRKLGEVVHVRGIDASFRLKREAVVELEVGLVEDAIGFEAVDRPVGIPPLQEPVAVVEAGEEEKLIGSGVTYPRRDLRRRLARCGRPEDGECDPHNRPHQSRSGRASVPACAAP